MPGKRFFEIPISFCHAAFSPVLNPVSRKQQMALVKGPAFAV